jgi:salicylate hydroxylase
MAINHVLILGGGIAGCAAALALTRHNKITCTIFEIRQIPSTIGGAINLTPNALRYLEHLGALERLLRRSCEVPTIDIFSLRTGAKLGYLDFDDVEVFKYRARRVLRADLLSALLETLDEAGIKIQYEKKAVSFSQGEDTIEINFEDGSTASGDILLGCDGIHSFVRTAIIEPERKPVYSGIATAYGLMDAKKIPGTVPFKATGLVSGRRGSLLLSYYDLEKTKLYAAAVMETAEVDSREGWKAKGSDQEAVKLNVLDRFGHGADKFPADAIQAVDEWFLYPVYKLPPKGKWSGPKTLLLGDAAHAVSLPLD